MTGRALTAEMELAERWRLAGIVLRMIDPVAFEALVHGAEIIVAETPESSAQISFPDAIA